MPWDAYVSSKVRQYHSSQRFGHRIETLEEDYKFHDPHIGRLVFAYNMRLTEEMNKSVKHWQEVQRNYPLNALLELPQSAFEKKREELVEHVLDDLRWLKERYAMRGGLFGEIPKSYVKSEKEIARLEDLEIQRMKEKYGEENFRVRAVPVIEK